MVCMMSCVGKRSETNAACARCLFACYLLHCARGCFGWRVGWVCIFRKCFQHLKYKRESSLGLSAVETTLRNETLSWRDAKPPFGNIVSYW